MKNIMIATMALLVINQARGQLVIGAQGMTISPNTTIYIDSLKLDNYNAPLTISNNSLQVSYQSLPGNPNNTIARVYEFTTPLAFNGTLGMYYGDGELGTNTEANLQISYQSLSGGPWTTTTNSIVAAPVNYVYSPGYNNNLYKVTAVSSGTVLPINLLSFNARKIDSRVLLEWVTSSEKNNDHFIIERSNNGRDFEILDRQSSKGQDGSSSAQLTYTYEDLKPLIADNFYRLQQVDKNGSITYSPVRLVSFDANKVLVNIYPNPAINQLYVNVDGYQGGLLTISMTDLNGRTLLNKPYNIESSATTLDIPLSEFAPGMYHLRLLDEKDNVIIMYRFVKQ